MIIEAPILVHFNPDFPIHLHCDASGIAIGCALLQPDKGGRERALVYSSRSHRHSN